MTTAAKTVRKKPRKRWDLFFISLPLMILVFIFSYLPLLGWSLSFFEYKPGTPLLANEFVGGKYFELIFNSRDIRRVMTNTIIFAVINFCLLPLPMVFAIMLNEISSSGFRKITQTLTTLPHFISWIIVYSLAFAIFSTEGLLNELLAMMGIKPQKLLQDKNALYWFQTCISQWKTLGWSSIIYIAAITGIDQELYEAAAIDGVNAWQKFWKITFPLIGPFFTINLVLSMKNALGTFDQVVALTEGGPNSSTETVTYLIWKGGLTGGEYAYQTANAVLFFIVLAIIAFVQLRISRSQEQI